MTIGIIEHLYGGGRIHQGKRAPGFQNFATLAQAKEWADQAKEATGQTWQFLDWRTAIPADYTGLAVVEER